MTDERPTDRNPEPYTPDETPPPPPMPPATRPEADEPRDYDSDTAGGGGRMPLPKEGKSDAQTRSP